MRHTSPLQKISMQGQEQTIAHNRSAMSVSDPHRASSPVQTQPVLTLCLVMSSEASPVTHSHAQHMLVQCIASKKKVHILHCTHRTTHCTASKDKFLIINQISEANHPGFQEYFPMRATLITELYTVRPRLTAHIRLPQNVRKDEGTG